MASEDERSQYSGSETDTSDDEHGGLSVAQRQSGVASFSHLQSARLLQLHDKLQQLPESADLAASVLITARQQGELSTPQAGLQTAFTNQSAQVTFVEQFSSQDDITYRGSSSGFRDSSQTCTTLDADALQRLKSQTKSGSLLKAQQSRALVPTMRSMANSPAVSRCGSVVNLSSPSQIMKRSPSQGLLQVRDFSDGESDSEQPRSSFTSAIAATAAARLQSAAQQARPMSAVVGTASASSRSFAGRRQVTFSRDCDPADAAPTNARTAGKTQQSHAAESEDGQPHAAAPASSSNVSIRRRQYQSCDGRGEDSDGGRGPVVRSTSGGRGAQHAAGGLRPTSSRVGYGVLASGSSMTRHSVSGGDELILQRSVSPRHSVLSQKSGLSGQDSLEPQDSMTSASPSRLAAMTSRSASRTGSLVPTPPTGRPPSTQDASSPFSRAFTLLAQASEKPTAASPRASRTVSYCGAANPLDMRSTPDGVFASGPERFVSPSRPASRAMSRVQVDTPSRVPSQSYSGVPQGDAETLGEDGFRASVRPGRVGRGSDCGKVLVPTKSKGSLLALFDDEVPFPGAAGEEGLGGGKIGVCHDREPRERTSMRSSRRASRSSLAGALGHAAGTETDPAQGDTISHLFSLLRNGSPSRSRSRVSLAGSVTAGRASQCGIAEPAKMA